ncbi:MAG: ATP synthase F1 subunit epsilon [Rickettsiaceae bacterium]|nr:ATP synthase F1 subunit epsilon [Rickettsiaceae bacterium]MDP4832259.1 ATP synthase F1 subunit epsilon [Rickettsiaceae bacterium]MDP5021024.1 ATP synthase F1 subunit epsilon [Rickettsiaceae bacterium]MDP5083571.1 ATP synthase F1 subunit epsilon [Rickettsiaceae bacterium]
MTETLLVKIILPSKVALKMDATLVNIPGSEGVFGVLPGHAKFASSIDVGVITLFSREETIKYFIYGGVAQITGSELNILSEFAIDLAKENTASVRKKITDLKNNLSEVPADSIEADITSDNIEKYQSLLNFI